MHIGILGYESNNSFTPLMVGELNKMGHIITQFSIKKVKEGISPYQFDDYLKFKKAHSLRAGISGWDTKLDFLIVAQSFLHWINDLPSVPVVYFHTELTSPLTIRGYPDSEYGWPTHIAMKLPEMENHIHSYDPWGWKSIKHHFFLWPAAHPPHYNPDFEKDWLVSYLGPPSDMFDRKRDWIWNIMTDNMKEIESYITTRNLASIVYDRSEEPATHPEYNLTMARSQHIILTAHTGVYIGRRHFEALASKTIPIIWVENDMAEAHYKNDIGFNPNGRNQNCYFFRHKEELDDIIRGLEYDPEIAERGYDLLLENHTFGHRALRLMKAMEASLHKMGFKVREEFDEEKPPLIYKRDLLVQDGS